MKILNSNKAPGILRCRSVYTEIGKRLQALVRSLILLALLVQCLAQGYAATGDLTFIEATKLSNAGRIVISPDGKHLYAASRDKYNWGILSAYQRDETTGSLTLVDTETKHNDPNGKQSGQGSIAVSPDGQYVFMGMLTGQCVLSFSRDTTTGTLDYIATSNTIFPGFGGGQNVNSLEISADGRFLYTTGGGGMLGRLSVDLNTGLLTPEEGIYGWPIMKASNRSRISPDQKHLYLSDINGNAIVVWDRDNTTGAVSNYRRFENGTGGALIDGPNDIRFSPDGEYLYVGVVRSDDSVTVLKRDTTTGDLSFSSTVAYGADRNPRNLFLSPAGDVLLAALQTGKRLSSYSVDASNGSLSLADEERNGIDGNKLDRPSGVTISPDGQFAYGSSYRDGYINVYALEAAVPVPAVEKIYWVEQTEVRNLNKDGSGDIETLVTGLERGFSIAVDEDGGKVYWADRISNKISRSDLDGSNIEDLYVFNSSSRPFTIALDVAAGDLYFASPDTKTLQRAKMDGSAAPIVIYDSSDASASPDHTSNPGIRDVRGIALDIAAGMIYWTDRGTGDDRVVRGSMDGTMTPQLLYTQVSGSAQDIALDIGAGMLYWANSGRGQIERAKMDGSGDRITVYSGSGTGGWPTGVELDVEAGHIYWSAVKDDTIRRGQMDGQTAPDSTPVVLASGLIDPWDIALASGGGSNSGGGSDPVDEAPVITLLGDNPLQVECGTAFSDPGATASDDLDGDISASIVIDDSAVNTAAEGSYVVTYDVVDSGGNNADQVIRTVDVLDTTAPVITLNGNAAITLECSIDSYLELGAAAADACDPNVAVVVGGDIVDPNSLGVYTVTYNAVDASGNVAAQVVRTVTVVDTTAPVIALNGNAAIVLECSIDSYLELGAAAADACDPNVAVVVGGDLVDPTTLGVYTVTYNAVDASGNVAVQVVRTVTVVDTTAPVITLNGNAAITLECSIDSYQELGAVVADACDPNVAVVIGGDTVDPNTLGVYTVTYDAVDASGNVAAQVVRTVTVVDTTAPVITLNGNASITLECSIDSYQELGAVAADACDPNVAVVVGGDTVDPTTLGVYTVTYDAVDASGNVASQVVRTVTVVDTTAPVITLNGNAAITLECSIDSYQELGAVAADACDPNVAVVVGGDTVDPTTLGVYTVTYDAVDASGNVASQVVRTVTVVDTTAPVITLNGNASITLECSIDSYQELGAVAADACDPNVAVVVGGDTVDPTTLGVYTVTYDAVDASGNVASQVVRTVTVVDTTAPVITLNGDALIVLECHQDVYIEDGASVFDACDSAVQVVITGSVDTDSTGSYTVTYDATDASGNVATQVVRTIDVVDTTAPVITIIGSVNVVLLLHDVYVEEGATVADGCDSNVTVVTDNSAVDTSSIGVFEVTYNATDASGNAAATQIRTVTILPRFAALDALFGCAELKLEEDAIVDGTIGGMSSIQLHKKSLVTGDVFNVLGDIQVHQNAQVSGTVDAGGKVTLHKKSVAGAVVSGLQVDLKKDAQVIGDVVSGGAVKLARGASVGGTISENQSIVPMSEIQLPTLNLAAGGSNVRVNRNDSILLAPGVYQNLQAKRNSTVELVSGHYSFSEFKVERGSELRLNFTDGQIIVDVVGELKMDGVEMSAVNGSAQDVLFQVQGDQAKLGTVGDDDEVFGAYIGTYLVANGQFMMESGATLIGAGYARSVMVKEDGLLQPEPAIDLLVAASAQWGDMVSCYEVIDEEESESSASESLADKSGGDSESKSKSQSKSKKNKKGRR